MALVKEATEAAAAKAAAGRSAPSASKHALLKKLLESTMPCDRQRCAGQ